MNVVRAVTGAREGSMRSVASIDRGTVLRSVTIAGLLVVVLFALPLVGGGWTPTFTSVAIYSVVAAGLGLLYGRVGMISLGQIALLALATWVSARFAYGTGIPFPLLLLIAGVITGVIGIVIGLPALRLSGLHLALITLMFAGAVKVILDVTNFPNGGGHFTGRIAGADTSSIRDVRRPAMALSDTAYFRFTVIVCALLFLLALWHLRSKVGRGWAAIRQSEPAALAAGVNVTLYKLWAFALAAFMTGVAGCLYAGSLGQPTTYGFQTQDSITLLATALIGGVFSLWGAIVAGALSQLLPFIFTTQWNVNANYVIILFGVGIVQVLLMAPGGLVEQTPKDIANLGRLLTRLVRWLARTARRLV